MREHARITGLAALIALGIATPRDARAWNSTCSEYENPTDRVEDLRRSRACCEGPDATRGRLRSPDNQDEHSQIFREASITAGLPSAVRETVNLRVYTADTTVSGSSYSILDPRCAFVGSLDSQAPVAFDAALRMRVRSFSVDELSMLPDFSFSLWDWIGGNETCPLRGYVPDGAIGCHTQSSHMGMANANHFPPMSDRYYARLHRMAVARAQRCVEQRNLVPANQQPRFEEYWHECETEALAIEAYAQHYMQDSFSSGHMWERWGATDVDRYPALPDRIFETSLLGASPSASEKRRLLAVLVGLTTGLIHGVEPVISSLPDALCHPYPDVRFSLSGGFAAGAGDTHYAGEVRADAGDLGALHRRLVECAASGVRAVYDALNPSGGPTPVHGALTSSMGAPRDPTGSECAGMRATNAAMFHGMGVDGPISVTHFDEVLAMTGPSALATMLWAPSAGVASRASLSDDGERLYAVNLVRMAGIARLRAALAPDDTDIASMSVPEGSSTLRLRLMTTERNSFYADHLDDGGPAELLASYQDPDLPWPVSADSLTPDAGSRGASIARAFQRAHIGELCATEGDALLARLRAAASATGSDDEGDRARCDVCAEVVARHLRVGPDLARHDRNAEPVCSFMPSNTGYAYQPVVGSITSPRNLARVWCGCAQHAAALTDAGFQPLALDGGDVRRDGSTIRTTTLPRDMAVTSDRRAVISHGDGTLAVLDLVEGVEVDTDRNAMTTSTGAPAGVTRLNAGSGAHGVAIVERDGQSFALVTVQSSDELAVYRLGTRELPRYELCERIDAGRDATRNEDAWDVLVMPDNLKAFVSFKGAGTNLGDAIAVIDVTRATDCTPRSGEVRSHITGVFGARAGIGAMALSPDASRMLVTARRAAACTVPVRSGLGSSTIDMPVGCDSVIVMNPVTDAVVPLPTPIPYLRTIPTYYPYAAAWFPDGRHVAFAQFSGPDSWPVSHPLGGGGAVRLGDGTTGEIVYNAGLAGNVVGESLLVDPSGRFVYAATMTGDVYALPGLDATGAYDAFWREYDADPENTIHGLPSWYGGCRTWSLSCVAGWCPAFCTDYVGLNVGSPVRALIPY